MNLFTEVHYIVMAVLAVLCLGIGYKWGRSNGMQAERARRRRSRNAENVKNRVVKMPAVQA